MNILALPVLEGSRTPKRPERKIELRWVMLFNPPRDPSGSFAVDLDLGVSPLKSGTNPFENLYSFVFSYGFCVMRRLPRPEAILPNCHRW